ASAQPLQGIRALVGRRHARARLSAGPSPVRIAATTQPERDRFRSPASRCLIKQRSQHFSRLEHVHIERIQRVLYQEAKLSISFHYQSSAEEQCIRVLASLQELMEVPEIGANSEIWTHVAVFSCPKRARTPCVVEAQARIGHFYA